MFSLPDYSAKINETNMIIKEFSMRLLIAEDDKDISRALQVMLEHNNYSVDAVFNGIDAYDYASCGNYDGIIMDIMMPGADGLTVLSRLRAEGIYTPVLLLTAKGEIEDRIAGLDAGADDYLPKPFAAGELMARVRAMLRRSDSYHEESVNFGGLILNAASYEICYEGNKMRLSGKEFQMLRMLMSSPGTIITTEQFMDKIWGFNTDVEVSIVWVNISNLRRKIDNINAPVSIKAVRGVGYYLEKKQEP